MHLLPVEISSLVWSGDSGAKRFRVLRDAGDSLPQVIQWQRLDYSGEIREEGGSSLRSDGCIEFPAPVEDGFHEYYLPEWGIRCGMIRMPRFGEATDPFWGMDFPDTVFLHCWEREEIPALIREYFRLLNFAGVRRIRERLLWHHLEKTKGVFDWNVLNADVIRRMATEENLEILEDFHLAPAWNRGSSPSPFPDDLIATAESFRRMFRHWQPNEIALEIWNEPDVGFGASLPGDQLGALIRTIAVAAQGSRLKLIVGAFTGNNCSRRQMAGYLDNGLLDYADAASFHDYNSPELLKEKLRQYRETFTGYYNADLPIVITECGKPWRAGTPRAAIRDDQRSAAWVTGKAVEARALGISGYYAFLMIYYDEFSNNFGFMDRCHTPMRSLAGYFNAVRFLAHTQTVGTWNGSRIFCSEERAILVRPGGGCVPSISGMQLFGADGRRLRTASENSEEYCYCVFPSSKLVELSGVERTIPAAPVATVRRPPRPVVPRLEIEKEGVDWTLEGYWFFRPEQVTLRIRLFNLSDKMQRLRLYCELPEGAELRNFLSVDEIAGKSAREVRLVCRLNVSGDHCSGVILLNDRNEAMEPLAIHLHRRKVESVSVRTEPLPEPASDYDKLDSSWTRIAGMEHWRDCGGGHIPSIRAAFRVREGTDELILEFLVESSSLCQPFAPAESWQGDSIQFAFQRDEKSGGKFTELCAARCEGRDVLYCFRSEFGATPGELCRSRCRIERLSSGLWRYCVNLNAAELGIERTARMPFSFIINSAAGGRDFRAGYLFWGDGIGNGKNPRLFNRLLRVVP